MSMEAGKILRHYLVDTLKNISDIVDKFKEEYSGGYTVLKNKNTNSIHINEALDVESLEDAVKKRGVKYIFHFTKRMSGIHLAIPVFSKGYRPKQGKVAP